MRYEDYPLKVNILNSLIHSLYATDKDNLFTKSTRLGGFYWMVKPNDLVHGFHQMFYLFGTVLDAYVT